MTTDEKRQAQIAYVANRVVSAFHASRGIFGDFDMGGESGTRQTALYATARIRRTDQSGHDIDSVHAIVSETLTAQDFKSTAVSLWVDDFLIAAQRMAAEIREVAP